MLELFQTEWCPASRRVRQRLTELGLDFVARQVPADPAKREELHEAAGVDTVPVLIRENGSPIVGEERILAYLGEHYEERAGAFAHRGRAEKARRKYLEKECQCTQRATR
jgi:glutathione S-transferase